MNIDFCTVINMNDRVEMLENLKRERHLYNSSWMNKQTKVGDFTYADHPRIWTWDDTTKLRIGKFCSIGANVQFLLGGEHHTEWATTYPFNVLLPTMCMNEEKVAKSKGDIYIGNDVWIGNNVTVLSGSYIPSGAVIGSNSLVTSSSHLKPYKVHGGVPAQEIKNRFDCDPNTLYEIVMLHWWNWPLEKIADALPLLCSSEYTKLIEFNKSWKSSI